MVREIKNKGISKKLQDVGRNPFFIPILFLAFLILTVPVITLVSLKPTDLEQRAATFREIAMNNFESTSGALVANENSDKNSIIDNITKLDGSGASGLALIATISTTVISVLVLGAAWFLTKKR